MGMMEKKIYIPRMGNAQVVCFSAALRAFGINGRPSPPSDEETLELAGEHLSGDECFPQKVTFGNFLKVVNRQEFSPDKVAFFMPTASGPCRFGQYVHLIRKSFREMGLEDIEVISPTSLDGYEGVAKLGNEFLKIGWMAIVTGDILTRLLHKYRPYEKNEGDAESVYDESLSKLVDIYEKSGESYKEKFKLIKEGLLKIKEDFNSIPLNDEERPLVGIVGEIFCRLNSFSNKQAAKKIEKYGGEVSLSNISEWIHYTNFQQKKNIQREKSKLSFTYMKAHLKQAYQNRIEHKLWALFDDVLDEDPDEEEMEKLLSHAKPYLPERAGRGEMILSIAKTIHLQQNGAAGVVDISPFGCMNGIVSDAIYPKISNELNNFPAKVFFFDEVDSDFDKEIEIFMELVNRYDEKYNK